jgi:hypothetical protein
MMDDLIKKIRDVYATKREIGKKEKIRNPKISIKKEDWRHPKKTEAPKPEAPKPEAPKPEAPKPEAPKPEAPKLTEKPKTESVKPKKEVKRKGPNIMGAAQTGQGIGQSTTGTAGDPGTITQTGHRVVAKLHEMANRKTSAPSEAARGQREAQIQRQRVTKGKPSLYLDNSVLFPRGKKKKSLMPDPQKEDLHPESSVEKAGAAQQSAGRTVDPPEEEAIRSNERSYQSNLIGISGATTVDDPDVGKDWHGDEDDDESPPDSLDLEDNKKSISKSIELLDSIPKFKGPYKYTNKEIEFLLEKGFDLKEIESCGIEITKQLRSEFKDFLKKSIFKSIAFIRSCGG